MSRRRVTPRAPSGSGGGPPDEPGGAGAGLRRLGPAVDLATQELHQLGGHHVQRLRHGGQRRVAGERHVRVVYTGRGMSKLDYVTDAWLRDKYGIGANQYADFAVMKGDASDGLPGVPGVGEKTAATLIAAHGDLAGILAAAEAGEGMSAGVRAKMLGALPYLAVAPKVVGVVRDLDLSADLATSDGRLASLTEDQRASALALASEWSLGTSMDRALAAIDTAPFV